MMRPVYLWMVIWLAALPAAGQPSAVDSLMLRYQAHTGPPDPAHLALVRTLALRYDALQPDSAVSWWKKALDLSRTLNDAPAEAQAHYQLGSTYRYLGLYEKSLENLYRAVDLAGRLNLPALEADAYRAIADVLSRDDNPAEALRFYDRALKLEVAQGDLQGQSRTLNNIGVLYFKEARYDSALRYYLRSYDIKAGLGQTVGMVNSLNNIGWLYLAQDSLGQALDFLTRAERLNGTARIPALQVWIRQGFGEYYRRSGSPAQALGPLTEALALAQSLGLKDKIRDCSESLSSVYADLGDHRQALFHHRRFKQYADTLRSEEITRLNAGYTLRETELRLQSEQRIKEAELNRKISTQQLIIGFTAIFLAISVVSVYQIAASRRKVAHANVALRKLSDSKSKLFSILSHDLRGPIGNLRSLQEELKESLDTNDFDSARDLADLSLKSSENSFLLLENLLNWSRSQLEAITVKKETVALVRLLEKPLAVLTPIARNKSITLEAAVAPQVQVFADPDMMETVFRNLIYNAIKFTPPRGTVRIFSHTGDGTIAVSVQDTGVGMPEARIKTLFDFAANTSSQGTSGETGTGLGLLVVHEFLTLNGARIEVQSSPGEGTVMTVVFPHAG